MILNMTSFLAKNMIYLAGETILGEKEDKRCISLQMIV